VSALIGAVVADAASLPLEWIYKPETMKVQFTKRKIMVFTTDRKSFDLKSKKILHDGKCIASHSTCSRKKTT
jgi:hypothetical protein